MTIDVLHIIEIGRLLDGKDVAANRPKGGHRREWCACSSGTFFPHDSFRTERRYLF
jgi:hypothetical protein